MEPIQVAKVGLESLWLGTCVHRVDPDPRRVQILLGDSVDLLTSLSRIQPNSFDLIVLDVPRASKRQKASLLRVDDKGEAGWSEVAHDDPDYNYRFRATTLLYARLALSTLSAQGVVLAIATPATYIAVRTALEQFLGADKFLGELVYQTRSGGGNDARWMSLEHETLMIFARDPEAVSRLGLAKTADELKKFREEDGESRFYWDTYIRKAARNYYPIRCPDGSVLQYDSNGNPISWLWREATFLEKLEQGEVKFVEHGDHPKWRLYYKARLIDLKIVRSLILNRTPLEEVSASAGKGETGAGLLTQDGSSEIRQYSGSGKPDYLKSSRFFLFLLQVFGRNRRVLIPFAEYGSAVVAAVDESVSDSRVVVIAPLASRPLIEWRLDRLPAKARSAIALRAEFPKLDITSKNQDPASVRAFLETLARGADSTDLDWFDLKEGDIACSVGIGKGVHVVIHALGPVADGASAIDVLSRYSDQISNSAIGVYVWSAFSELAVRRSMMLPVAVKFRHFPACLIR